MARTSATRLMAMNASDDELWTKLNHETARITWQELQPHFARGVAVRVATELDLVQVAVYMARDDRAMIADWMRSGQIAPVSVEEAHVWHAGNAVLWAVVAAPWVLVQDRAA